MVEPPTPPTAPGMPPTAIPPSVWADLGEETGLDVPADRLRQHLEIPNFTTPSGLREAHADFDQIQQRLDECYAAALAQGHLADAALVCIIWTKMAADAVLRGQLIPTGLVLKLNPLLATPLGAGMLEELVKTLINADEELALNLFRNNLDIVRSLRARPEDAGIADLTIRTLSHTFLQTLLRYGSSHPDIFDELCLIPVLSVLLDTLRDPPHLLPEAALTLAMSILAKVPLVCPQRCRLKDVPSLLAYYAAVSRSRSLPARCNAVATVLHLARAELQTELRPSHDADVHPTVAHSGSMTGSAYTSLDDFLSALPFDLLYRIMRYSRNRCECVVEWEASSDASTAISQYHRGDDLCGLGLRLAELVQRAEFVVDLSADLPHWSASDGGTLKQSDLLSLCAASLAGRPSAVEQDAADALELHYLLATHADPGDIVQRAQRAMTRNAHLAFAHYAYAVSLSLSSVDVDATLRAIEDAVACEGQTAFLQRQLLARTVQFAGQHAFDVLHRATVPDTDTMRMGMAYFKQAIDAAAIYLERAPPDSRQLPAVLSWYLILRFVFEEPLAQNDLSRCRLVLEHICEAERLTKFRHHPPAKTDIQLTREWLFDQYRRDSIWQWTRLMGRLECTVLRQGVLR